MGAPVSMRNTQSSGAITASANIQGNTVLDKSGVLCGVLVAHDGSTDAVVTIYDDAGTTATAGKELFYCKLDAAVHKGEVVTNSPTTTVIGGSGKYQEYFRLPDVIFKLGCYVAITATGAETTVIVYYR